jgi:hypothetical protein
VIKLRTSCHQLFPFGVPQSVVKTQIEDWIRGVLRSNEELLATLELLRDSYCAMLAGQPATNPDEIVAQVEATLKSAARV